MKSFWQFCEDLNASYNKGNRSFEGPNVSPNPQSSSTVGDVGIGINDKKQNIHNAIKMAEYMHSNPPFASGNVDKLQILIGQLDLPSGVIQDLNAQIDGRRFYAVAQTLNNFMNQKIDTTNQGTQGEFPGLKTSKAGWATPSNNPANVSAGSEPTMGSMDQF